MLGTLSRLPRGRAHARPRRAESPLGGRLLLFGPMSRRPRERRPRAHLYALACASPTASQWRAAVVRRGGTTMLGSSGPLNPDPAEDERGLPVPLMT